MAQEVRTGERQSYATKIAGLWSGLSQTLARLEKIAAEPESLVDSDVAELLPGLQYTLHSASELVAGIAPPVEARTTHAELASALADARDATAEIADAAAAGGFEAAMPLVWEWRGSLFRVRLARMRLHPVPEPAVVEPEAPSDAAAAAVVLALAGAIAVALAALLAVWPLAAGGLALVAFAILRRWP